MVYQRKRYSWSNTFAGRGIDANVVGKTLERIEASEGQVSKENFLEASRPEESATHGLFEWDNEVAGEKYRLMQSGKIINSLEVEIVSEKRDPEAVKLDILTAEDVPEVVAPKFTAFVNVSQRQKERGYYVNSAKAMSDEETRSLVIRRALLDLNDFQRKYSRYEEFAELMMEIDRLEKLYGQDA